MNRNTWLAINRMGCLALALACAQTVRGGAKYWLGTTPSADADANWSDTSGGEPSTCPQDGDDIVLDAGSGNRPMTWNLADCSPRSWTQTADYAGTVTFDRGLETVSVTGDVSLQGGTWTHVENPSFKATDEAFTSGRGTQHLIVSVGGAMTLGANAAIDVSAKGFAGGQGPGFPASHGAVHAGLSKGNPKACYGSVCEPDTLGSGANAGGGTSWYAPGNGRGGGAVRLTVAGRLTVEGLIAANGSDGTHYTAAGGSVFLTAGAFGGAGQILALGAASSTTFSGSGGRIAVILTGADADFAAWAGTMSAAGGKTSSAAYEAGGNGTIYLETRADEPGCGELVLAGRGDNRVTTVGAGLMPSVGTQCAFRRLTFRDGGALCVCAGTTVCADAITPVTSGKNESLHLCGGTLEIPGNADFGVLRFTCLTAGSVIRPFGSSVFRLPVGITHSWSKALTVDGSLWLPSGAVLAHEANETAEGYLVDVTVAGSLTIDAGASIDTSGCGFKQGNGPGVPTASGYCGGSHGGLALASGGSVYGSVKYPLTSGSGGQSPWTGKGGGVVRLVVDGELTVNGEISSDSTNVAGGTGYYTSAGGSVWITAGSLAGAGNIHADGAKGQNSQDSRSGAGGRVAVTLTEPGADFSAFGGRISAYGAVGAKKVPQNGGGTVYLRTGDQDDVGGTLIIDNGGSDRRDVATPITADVTDAEVGNVLVRNGGVLDVTQGGVLTVHGDWTTEPSGTVRTALDGLVRFVDAGRVSTIAGTNFFGVFVCEDPGKTLKFATADSLFATVPGGTLTLTGSEVADITLDSDNGVDSWRLALGSGTVQNLNYLTVNRSDASYGAKAVAQHSQGEGNANWSLVNIEPGETIVWTGADSDGFSDAGNWDRERAPVPTDNVVIAAGAPNMPTLSADLEVDGLSVAAGAVLDLNGFDLTVRQSFSVKGLMRCKASERIVIACDGEIAAFECASSELRLASVVQQRFDFGGCAVHDLVLASGGDLLLNGGFAADSLECRSATAKTLTFEAARSYAVRQLTLTGPSADSAFLALVSSAPGSAWSLTLGETHTVMGVSVSDCDASAGRTLYPSASQDAGRNANWDFDKTTAVWVGGSGNDFHVAANWSPAEVPGETTRVLLDADVEVRATAPVALFALEIRGTSGTTLVTREKLTVSDMLVVGNGGVLEASGGVEVMTAIVQDGGLITHAACTATVANRLDLSVTGDLRIERGGRIDVTAKGYPAGTGPGFAGNAGASYGGQGAYGEAKDCYGSILNPTDPGSGGAQSWGLAGGGVVNLTVAGTLYVDGEIVASSGQPTTTRHYNGTGGSINIRCGTLQGEGTIRAPGGDVNSATSSAGGGGRIAVRQSVATDFARWRGRIGAIGGRASNGASAAAGTVYLRSAGEEIGTVVIDNDWTTSFRDYFAQIPMAADGAGAYRDVAFVLKKAGMVKLTADVTVYDLDLADANCQLNLNGHTLTILSRTHKKRRGWHGSVEERGGKIEWRSGLVLVIR